MILQQFVDAGLGCASYLIGDEKAGVAAVVDPAFAIEQYVAEAEREGLRLERTLETHTHADHLSGHGRLALDHGCSVAIHSAAEAEFEHEALEDGAEIGVGDVRLRVLHTPGHRPEHCAFLVLDEAGEEKALLTGDSLFVGEAARPDLAVGAREGAEGLFDSLRRLTELDDAVEVLPGHVAGSLCGSGMSAQRSTTIGFEKRFNRALQFGSAAEFVDAYGSPAQLRPPNMDRNVALNRGPFVGAPPKLDELESNDAGGATILDVRDVDTFAAGHAHGAINVPVEGSMFATKAAFLLEPEERIVLHAASRDQAERAAAGLHSVALLELAGYVTRPPADERVDDVGLDDLQALLDRGDVEVIDVREKDERDGGYIPGTRHVPYRLLRVMGASVDGDRPVVTICNTGARAAIAASVLSAAGVDARPVLHGGVPSWPGQKVEFRRCGS